MSQKFNMPPKNFIGIGYNIPGVAISTRRKRKTLIKLLKKHSDKLKDNLSDIEKKEVLREILLNEKQITLY